MRGTPVGYTAYFYQESQDWDRWSYDMDRLQDLGATCIRAGFTPWMVQDQHLDHIERCLQDCQARGIDVMLTCAQLANNGDQTVSEAIAAGSAYVARLAPRFAPYARWWQVLNEHDHASWLNQKYLGDMGHRDPDGTQHFYVRAGMTQEYLESLRDVLALSRDAIHAANPDCMVGTATTGVEMDVQCEQYIWRPFYDVVAPAVDWIGINGYPMKWMRMYREMPARLRRTSVRYGKPVMMAECGHPTNGSEDEPTIMELLAHQIDRMTRSTSVGGMWLYQLRDRADDPDSAEACFGTLRYDGTWKDGWRAVRYAIRSITDDIGPNPA